MNKDHTSHAALPLLPFAEQSPHRGAHHRQPARFADRAAARRTDAAARADQAARTGAAGPASQAGRTNEAAGAGHGRRSEAGERGRASPARWRLAARLHDRQRRRPSWSISRRSSSWVDQKHVVAYAAVSYTPKGAEKPALGTVKVESDTSVALDERLVSFSELKITEPSFPDAAARSAPDRRRGDRRVDAARRARDRARPRAGQHRHQQDHPEERRGREGGSAADLLQQDARGARQHRRRPDLGADPAERSEDRGQHQLGSVRARADQDLLPSQRPGLAEGGRREGAVGPGRHAAGELQEAAGRRQLERGEGEPPRPVDQRQPGAEGVRQPAAGGADSAARRAELSGRRRARTPLLWVSNTESDVFRMGLKGPVYFLVAGRWFSAPDFTGPWTFATPNLPADVQADSARASALARPRVGAGHGAGSRSHSARADSADGARQQDGAGARGHLSGRHRRVPADRDDDGAARGQYRQGHPQGRRPLLHVLPGRVVHVEGGDRARGRSPERCRSRSTRSR